MRSFKCKVLRRVTCIASRLKETWVRIMTAHTSNNLITGTGYLPPLRTDTVWAIGRHNKRKLTQCTHINIRTLSTVLHKCVTLLTARYNSQVTRNTLNTLRAIITLITIRKYKRTFPASTDLQKPTPITLGTICTRRALNTTWYADWTCVACLVFQEILIVDA